MKQAPLPYEQLHLPEPTPADQPVVPETSRATGLTDEEERLWDLQDSKAESHAIIERRMRAGKLATDQTAELVGNDEPENAAPSRSPGPRRRGAYKNGRPKISGPRTAAALRHADQRPDLKPFPYGNRQN